MRPLSLLVLERKMRWIEWGGITMGKNIHRAWVSRVRKAGMIVRSVDNGREDNEIVGEREVHTRWEGRERIIGVASRDAKRFLCDCDQREQLDWRGTKTKQLRGESFIVLVDHEPHFVTLA